MINWIQRKRNKKGFTLIELVVVIAILGILAALAIPRLTGSRDKANRSAILANLRTIESAYSIATAEGAFEGTGATTKDIDGLVAKNYLASAPSGPSGLASTAYVLGNYKSEGIVATVALPETAAYGQDLTGQKSLKELLTDAKWQ